MWCSDRRGLLVLALAGGLAACGFTPLYAPGGPAASMAGQVVVEPLDGTAGFALYERLTGRLGPPTAATHRLVVDLTLDQSGVALTQENFTTRFDVVGTAAFRLVPLNGGPPVVIDEVRSITGYSAPISETSAAFASRAAEIDAERRLAQTLAEQIVQRLALSAPEWAVTLP